MYCIYIYYCTPSTAALQQHFLYRLASIFIVAIWQCVHLTGINLAIQQSSNPAILSKLAKEPEGF